MSSERTTLIRVARAKRNMSQGDLADATGLSRQMIGHIETGRKGVTYENARAIAKVLRLSWKDLYTGKVPARVMAELAKDGAQ